MKQIVAFLSVVALMTSVVLAAEVGGKTKGHEGVGHFGMTKAPAAEEITLTGILSKEAAVAAAAGQPAGRAKFFLTDESGAKIALHIEHHAKAGAVVAPNVEEFVGQKVKLVVMGHQTERDGSKDVVIVEVKSIDKVKAVAVPAAGAAAK